jgi:FRG domain
LKKSTEIPHVVLLKKTAKPVSIKSVSQFVDHVMSWKEDNKIPTAFRGQKFDGWITQPKIFRDDIGLHDHENSAVRDLVSVHPDEFRSDNTMFDRLVRMQHFELPTRLLDVSTNPLVALWFATEEYLENSSPQNGKVQAFFVPEKRQRYYDSDLVSCMANFANLKMTEKQAIGRALTKTKLEFNKEPAVASLLYHIGMEKHHFRPIIDPNDLTKPVYVKPKMSNRRIIAQSGAFIIFGAKRPGKPLNDGDLKFKKVTIPADAKRNIRHQLERLGIHASSLFPEIDKAANFILRRYQTASPSDEIDLLSL